MSSQYKKIKYEIESVYGTTEEKYLYIESNNTIDVVSVYTDDGTLLFSYSESGFDMGQALTVGLNNWNDTRLENVTLNEWNKLIK